MAFTGQNIADEARGDLNDDDALNYRWTDADMLRYINAAQRRIVSIVPEANVVEENVVIDNADSRQTLPTGGIKFIGAFNYDATNSERGPAITIVEKDALDSMSSDWSYVEVADLSFQYQNLETWHTAVRFEHAAHDSRDPTVYYLFPATDTATFEIQLQYAKVPTALTTLADSFALGDQYFDAAVAFSKYRMHAKDGRHGGGSEVKQESYNDFLRALGQKIEGFRRVDPAVNRPPESPHG